MNNINNMNKSLETLFLKQSIKPATSSFNQTKIYYLVSNYDINEIIYLGNYLCDSLLYFEFIDKTNNKITHINRLHKTSIYKKKNK